jgi:putative FmdB family regulatory protein
VPTYQYACTSCGEQTEAVQRFSDDPLTVCPACGGALRKVYSPVGIVFKGSGFYRTDSRKSTIPSGEGKHGGAGQDSGEGKEKEKVTAKANGSGDGASKNGSPDSGSSSTGGKPATKTPDGKKSPAGAGSAA